jgi:hypothetical protein
VAYRLITIGQRAKKQEAEATVLAMVRRKLRKYKAGKIRVYGNLVAKVKVLAEKIGCQALVRWYVGESGAARCRRVVLDGYLDRREVERVGCEEGEERCDVYRGEESEEEDGEDPSEVEETGLGESVDESEGERLSSSSESGKAHTRR